MHFRLNVIQTLSSMNCSTKHDLDFFLFQDGPPCIGFNYILPTATAQEISFNFRAWLLVGGERSRCKKLWRKEDERRKRRSFTGPTMGSKPIWSLPGFPGLPGLPDYRLPDFPAFQLPGCFLGKVCVTLLFRGYAWLCYVSGGTLPLK